MRQDIEKRSSDRAMADTNRHFSENRMSIRRRTPKLSCPEERIIVTRAYFAAKQQSGRLHDSLIAESIYSIHYRLKFAPCTLWQYFETKNVYLAGIKQRTVVKTFCTVPEGNSKTYRCVQSDIDLKNSYQKC